MSLSFRKTDLIKCCYCSFKMDDCNLVIQHLSSSLSNGILKIRQYVLDHTTGKLSFQTKNYNLTPSEYLQTGQTIHYDSSSGSLTLTIQ